MGLYRRNGLSSVNQYKDFEKKISSGVLKGFRGFFRSIGGAFRKFFQFGRQHFTIMLIPHSEKQILNLKISVFTLIFLGLLLAAGVSLLGFYTFAYPQTQQQLVVETENRQTVQANLDLFLDEAVELGKVGQEFEVKLNETLQVLGVDPEVQAGVSAARGDLGSLIGLAEVEAGTPKEIGQLQALKAMLEGAVDPLSDISRVLQAQKQLLVDIPTLWPLKGVRGWVTLSFGPAKHPFRGTWYIHQGLDIAQLIGTPIVATANGKVTKVDYSEGGYGNYIDLQHKYGFSTKYAHLSRTYVSKGQEVSRGEVIGALGNTGLSTGPHVHYEVRIGTQLVDPAKYLNISSTIVGQ